MLSPCLYELLGPFRKYEFRSYFVGATLLLAGFMLGAL